MSTPNDRLLEKAKRLHELYHELSIIENDLGRHDAAAYAKRMSLKWCNIKDELNSNTPDILKVSREIAN